MRTAWHSLDKGDRVCISDRIAPVGASIDLELVVEISVVALFVVAFAPVVFENTPIMVRGVDRSYILVYGDVVSAMLWCMTVRVFGARHVTTTILTAVGI